MSAQWVMTVPVISTSHTPSGKDLYVLYEMATYHAMDTDCSDFIFMMLDGEPDEYPEWSRPLVDWLQSNYPHRWVRFDRDGDVIKELPTYDR